MEIDMMCGGMEIKVGSISTENGEIEIVHGYNAPAVNTSDRKWEKFQTEVQFIPDSEYLVKIREIRDLNPLVGKEVSVK